VDEPASARKGKRYMSEIYVGIDVSKEHLDVAILPSKERRREVNDEAGTLRLIEKLKGLSPTIIVLEPTGGLEAAVAGALWAEGLPVVVVNARQIRDYARATGRLAKTDVLDALVMAEFGRAVRPELRPPHSKEEEALRAVVVRRRQLIQMLTMEKNRLTNAQEPAREDVSDHIEYLKKRLDIVDKDLRRLVGSSPIWKEKDDLLRSIPGIGKAISVALLAGMPELGSLSRKRIAALAGIAPLNRDSGHLKGSRHIWGGRAAVRAALYMAALVGTRYNPLIKTFYKHLLTKGKAKKVALVACMRKLLTIINAVIRQRKAWRYA